MAVLFVFLAYLFRLILNPLIGERTYTVVLFLLPVPFSVWIGGIGPGVLATILALLAGDTYSLYANIPLLARVVRIGTFLFQGIFVSWLIDRMAKGRLALVQAESQAFLLREAVGASSDGIVVTDMCLPDHPLIYVNSAFEKNTGYTATEALGKNCRFLQGTETSQTELATLKEAIQKGEACKVTFVNYRKDGSSFWNELSISPVRNSSGKITHFIGIQRDVSKFREAQEQILESEQRHRATVESSRNAVMSMDEHGGLKSWNKSTVRIFGYADEEMMGMPLEILIAERDQARYRQVMERLLATSNSPRPSVLIEMMAEHRTGREFPAEFALSQWRIGEKIYSSAIVQDITERKEAEKNLLDAQHSLERRVQERTAELTAINEKLASEVTERKHVEEVLQKQAEAIRLLQRVTFAANMTSGINDILKKTLDQVCQHTGWEVGHVYLPSETKTNELISTDFWHLKEPVLMADFKEATQKMKAERSMDMPGRVFITGEPVWISDLSKDFNFSRLKVAHRCGLKASVSFPVLVKMETVAVLEFFTTSIIESDGSMLEVLADVGVQLGRVIERERNQEMLERGHEELQRIMLKLRENQMQLIQSEKLAGLGQLAAGVAHEINNPVGFIMSNLNTLGEYVAVFKKLLTLHTEMVNSIKRESGLTGESAELSKRYDEVAKKEDLNYVIGDIDHLLEESTSGSKRVREIVNNLKSFARLDESDLKEANINDGIEATLKLVWNELKYKCQVHKKYGDIPLMNCYPGQLNQVFMNLLVNAGQAIKEKGEITIETSATESEVIIKITDSGQGIAPENLSKLFTPFFTTKPVGVGTGLGLSISYGIVQKHRGRIEVESQIGVGTTFTVILPRDAVLCSG